MDEIGLIIHVCLFNFFGLVLIFLTFKAIFLSQYLFVSETNHREITVTDVCRTD